MDGTVLDAGGVPAKPSRWDGMQEPKGSSPYFGWIDASGDPATIRVDLIAAVARDSRTGRFVIIMANAGATPTITDQDAYRLMRRMGWTVEEKPRKKNATQV